MEFTVGKLSAICVANGQPLKGYSISVISPLTGVFHGLKGVLYEELS